MNNSYTKIVVIILALCVTDNANALKIKRVILSANNNSLYLDFWPYAAKAWSQIVGIRPTLALIADKSVTVDTSVGDVLRFDPIPGVPTGLHAQLIRLLMPAYFKEGCIISDIDQLPLQRSYFIDAVASVPSDHFVVYNNKCYGQNAHRFPMCYVAATGAIFSEVFNIRSLRDIPFIIKQWVRLGRGFNTDEFVLYKYLTQWRSYKRRCTKLNDTLGPRDTRRINRSIWGYDPDLVKRGYYVDAHLLRPYTVYKRELDVLATLGGVKL